mmetsp:Transcript_3551/g.9586  ORF Transcript_3551/g.9586 Transcript_3551/m.9586 type:complete len:217 (-) Transcript_3551:1007-1657(-)
MLHSRCCLLFLLRFPLLLLPLVLDMCLFLVPLLLPAWLMLMMRFVVLLLPLLLLLVGRLLLIFLVRLLLHGLGHLVQAHAETTHHVQQLLELCRAFELGLLALLLVFVKQLQQAWLRDVDLELLLWSAVAMPCNGDDTTQLLILIFLFTFHSTFCSLHILQRVALLHCPHAFLLCLFLYRCDGWGHQHGHRAQPMRCQRIEDDAPQNPSCIIVVLL